MECYSPLSYLQTHDQFNNAHHFRYSTAIRTKSHVNGDLVLNYHHRHHHLKPNSSTCRWLEEFLDLTKNLCISIWAAVLVLLSTLVPKGWPNRYMGFTRTSSGKRAKIESRELSNKSSTRAEYIDEGIDLGLSPMYLRQIWASTLELRWPGTCATHIFVQKSKIFGKTANRS